MMASIVVCDVCGKPLERPFYKLRAYKAEANQESRDMKTAGTMDIHEACMKILKDWLKENQRKEAAK
jgi:hypothetical protein